MSNGADSPSFDVSRAELFEALSHPIRIKILHALEGGPLGFADLKRMTGIESSGHLQFHLGKLNGLIQNSPNGAYALTDDGRDALRVMGRNDEISGSSAGLHRKVVVSRGVLAAFVVATIVIAAFAGALYFQSTSAAAETRQQLANLAQQLTNLTQQLQGVQQADQSLANQRGFEISSLQLSPFVVGNATGVTLYHPLEPNVVFTLRNDANASVVDVSVYVNGWPVTYADYPTGLGKPTGLPLPPGQSITWGVGSSELTTAGLYDVTFLVTFGDGSVHAFDTLASVS